MNRLLGLKKSILLM